MYFKDNTWRMMLSTPIEEVTWDMIETDQINKTAGLTGKANSKSLTLIEQKNQL